MPSRNTRLRRGRDLWAVLESFKLTGKTALVTGSASGLGAAIAIAFAEAGAQVAVHGNRRPADDTAAAIVKAGGKATAFSADLSATDGADGLFKAVTAACGPIDILVNNAGMIFRAEATDVSAWTSGSACCR